jgi:large subunit ribosomal protein L2
LSGSIVVRHRQKGTKKNYLMVDFNRRISTQLAVCINLTYDINRSAFLALIKYSSGIYSYILAPQGVFYGDFIRTCQNDMIYCKGYRIGYATFLRNLPIDSIFFNVELTPDRGGQYARAAGSYCTVISEDEEKRLHVVQLPTGKPIIVSSYCVVTLGKCSNPLHYKERTGKAGTNRKKG